MRGHLLADNSISEEMFWRGALAKTITLTKNGLGVLAQKVRLSIDCVHF